MGTGEVAGWRGEVSQGGEGGGCTLPVEGTNGRRAFRRGEDKGGGTVGNSGERSVKFFRHCFRYTQEMD